MNNKEWVQELKRQNPCSDCGKYYPAECMDFDHLDPETKICKISRLYTSTLERIKEEIDKCELVCANCHRMRTFSVGHQAK